MSKRWSPKAIWLGLAAVTALGVAGTYAGVRALVSSAPSDKSILTGRIWIDHAPKKDTEYFEVFVALEQSPTGVFEKGSLFEGQFEVFRYDAKGSDKLSMTFPQRSKKFDVKYTAKSCSEGDFNYCLTLAGAPRGAPKYLSRTGWAIEGGALAEIEPKLGAWKATLDVEHAEAE
ncbi:MAG: hypothetical protein U0414_14245 [Polyangiaceae bacterium]